MDTIYRKTAKGTQEIGTRAHGLQPRMRSALILVDGQRSAAALRQLVGEQCDEHLRALLAEGFIEALAVPPPAPGPAPVAPSAARPPGAAPAPAAAPGTTAASAALRRGVPFEVARRDAVRDFVDRVGPLGEAMAIRLERARNAEELSALLDTAANIVANVRGAGAAQDYLQRHRGG